MTGDPGVDGGLFAPIVTTDALLEATSGAAWVQAMLDAEAALASAEEAAGLIPPGAAAAIAAALPRRVLRRERARSVGPPRRQPGHPAGRRAAGAGWRAGVGLGPLGSDQPGHPRHCVDAGGRAGVDIDRDRADRPLRRERCARRAPPLDAHGRPHAPPAGAAHHVRAQDRGLALGGRRGPLDAPGDPGAPAGPARRRGRDPGVARGARRRGHGGHGRRARALGPGPSLACRPRRGGRGRRRPRDAGGHRRQNRAATSRS